MHISPDAEVFSLDGQRGRLAPVGTASEDTEQVLIVFDNKKRVMIPPSVLTPQREGQYLLPLRLDNTMSSDAPAETLAVGEKIAIPVIVEEVRVTTEAVETGRILVHKSVAERVEMVDVPLMHEELKVERRPINLPVEGVTPGPRQEGETLVIPVLEEVLFVEKRLFVREEWRIDRVRSTYTEQQEVVLRSEKIEVQRESPVETKRAVADGPNSQQTVLEHETRIEET